MYGVFVSAVRVFLLCVETVLVINKAFVFTVQAFFSNWLYMPLSSPDRNYLRHKKVLITGSAGGLGSALALKLLQKGAFLIMVDRKTVDSNKHLDRKRCVSYVCDISQRNEVSELVTKVKRDVGHVDMIVNNAAVLDGELITDLSENVMLKTFHVNVFSHLWLIKAFLPEMLARKSGHVVTIGSVVAQLPVAQLPAYCASKAAAGALLEALSTDLHRMGASGIYTTLVCPGHLQTEMFRNVFIRFPMLTPSLSAHTAADRIIDAIERKQPVLYLPRRYFVAVVLKHFLPTKVYWLMHSFLKTHHGMDTFEGKKLV